MIFSRSRLGIPAHVGPVEQRCYQLQRLLTPEEKRRWTAAANATADSSDDTIRAHETAATSAALTATGRQSLCTSVPTETRDAWFKPRLAHLKQFLTDQLAVADGRRKPARAAALSADPPPHPTTTPAPVESADPLSASAATATSPGSREEPSDRECRLRAARADLIDGVRGQGQPNNTPLPPPEYFGANAAHANANKQEFWKRKDCQACFACPVTRVKYDTHHLNCPQHGLKASTAKRTDPKHRVKGAALPGAAF